MCDTTNNEGYCLSASTLADPELIVNDMSFNGGAGGLRGAGCKHDGGPLWVSIPIVDDPVVA